MRLGIDFGTSSTVAVLALPDREPRPLLFDGSPLLPSAVGLDPTGRLIVGRDALHAATATPGLVERHPKRCIDDSTVLLGTSEFAVTALFAAVLGRVLDEASRASGGAPTDEIVLTHPAAWGKERRATLREAAGLATVRLVSEPIAAAHHLVDVAGERLPDGATAVVYDFGAGTFDASVVRRSGGRFDVLATQGRPDSGGLDIDAAIVAHLAGAVPATGSTLWARLDKPESTGDRRARQQLWDNVRTGKESLSRATSTLIHVPLLDLEVPLGREELDRLSAPILERTVETTRAVLHLAGVEADAIFLVGGASRMPAVVSTLHRAFGVEPVTVDQPELAVAEGSLGTGSASAVDTDDWPAAEAPLVPAIPRSRRPRVLLAAGAGVAIVAVAAAAALANRPSHPAALPSPPASASPSASPSPSVSYAPGVDPCLLGTWRTTSQQVYGTISGERVQYSGGAGTIVVYKPDGTVTIDYAATAPSMVDHRGVHWEDTPRGFTVLRWDAKDGEMLTTVLSTTSKHTLTRNGKFNNSGPGSWLVEPEKYRCSATLLVESSTQGNWASESVRVS